MLVVDTDLPLRLVARGKVRDVYEVDADRLLLVATDRVSAFDVVLGEAIPHKGAVLTQLTAWWLGGLRGVLDHHLITADAADILTRVPALAGTRSAIEGRSMLCHRIAMLPIECVVRGYLSGSAWKEYATGGTLAGEKMSPGLVFNGPIDPPVFSPATKATSGHDENISLSRARSLVGGSTLEELERLSRIVYEHGRDVAADRGIIIADTKLEFGLRPDGAVVLGDEVLTPDSSRFWPSASYEAGRPQASFDKQPLRDWLDRERAAGRWNGESPPPRLPTDIVAATSRRYLDAFETLTGSPLPSLSTVT
ncbi:MAG: phosphoribosylaminoimidazolesuccinocarboxamide synthase [Gemmatimonadaceae bacterium]